MSVEDQLIRGKKIQATNGIEQGFDRSPDVEQYLVYRKAKLSLCISHHPWVHGFDSEGRGRRYRILVQSVGSTVANFISLLSCLLVWSGSGLT